MHIYIINGQFNNVSIITYYRLRTLGSNSPMIDKLTSDSVSCQSTASITGSPHIARLHRYASNPLQSKVETITATLFIVYKATAKAFKDDNRLIYKSINL